MKSHAVCFFGPDGSGKSTLAKHVAWHLERRGMKTRVTWLRGTHTLASVLARFLSEFDAFRGGCNPYYGICIPRSLRGLWLWIEFVSVLPVVFVRFVFPRVLGRVVVAERSLIDFLVWLVLTLRWCGVVRSLVARIVLALNRSICSYVIYVHADEEALLSRRRGSVEEPLIPVELRIYDAVAEKLSIPCIDTSSRSIHKCVADVLKMVGASRE